MSDEPEFRCAIDDLESCGHSHEEAIAEVERRHDEIRSKGELVAHFVFDHPETPWGVEAHTHGVLESFGHPDFQIVSRLPPGAACEILGNLVESVEAGRRFAAGETAAKIIRGLDVGFAEATEGDREVLRVILPDQRGRLARGEIDPEFARQYSGTR